MEPHKEFTITRIFDAPREAVFKAWTDAKLVAQWWGPEGVFTPICEVDARPGGLMHIVMEAGESLGQYKGMQWPMEGKFEEVEEPSKLVFTANAIMNGKEVLVHRTTVIFEEIEGKTKMSIRVVVTKTLPGAENALAGMEQGWNGQIDKLGRFITEK